MNMRVYVKIQDIKLLWRVLFVVSTSRCVTSDKLWEKPWICFYSSCVALWDTFNQKAFNKHLTHFVYVQFKVWSSPAAFEHGDVVGLSVPRREVDAGLQSVLVKGLQDHSLCIHVYKLWDKQVNHIHNNTVRSVNVSFCDTVSYPGCPPGSRGWLWANDTDLLWWSFCWTTDGNKKNHRNIITDGWRSF